MQNEPASPSKFVQRQLPWIIAAGALLVYLLTLNRWITFSGLPVLTKSLGWDWRPMYFSPLHYLVTYPFRWLPVGWQLPCLNFFSAVCAAWSLALLARAVALLPHDRTREQRALERSEFSFLSIKWAWIPPVLAAAVCGLQLSFWENAVVELGEALDLLVFAWCVRCVLEFRVEHDEKWAWCLAVAYGVGITNNHAMIAFAPAFLAALVWIKGRTALDWRFWLKFLGWGAAGLSFYLVLPLINSFSDLVEQDFFEMLRTYWSFQRNTILAFPRYVILLISFTSLLPVVFIGIRWPAQFGDISAMGNLLTNVLTHAIHVAFLAACLWVAFDPAFSPRNLGPKWGQPWAFLPIYFLGALTIGYCSGYVLLVFGSPPSKPWQKPSLLEKALYKVLVAAVGVALVAVPAGLVYRNLPQLRADHARHLSDFGHTAARSLPPQGAAVLSDDPYRLYALQAAVYHAGTADKYVLVDTTSLSSLAYHRAMRRQYGARWPKVSYEPPTLAEPIDTVTLIQWLRELQRGGETYYLHPSFGYYFESFYLKPRRLVYQLLPAPTNTVENPPLTAAEIRENDEFWKELRAGQLAPLIQALQPAGAEPEKPLPFALSMAGALYSRALNFLGVECQRSGDLLKAREYFAAALELNTNNPCAFINQEFNQLLRAGQRPNPVPSEGAARRLFPYGKNWELLLSIHGPLDEPYLGYPLAFHFASGQNYRQAAQFLLRVTRFTPENFDARVGLANMYILNRLPDHAITEIAAIRADPLLRTNVLADPVSLIQVEARAHAAKGDLAAAERILREAQEKYPFHRGAFAAHAQLHMERDDATNALAVLERQMKVQTNNIGAMISFGAMKMRLNDPAAAVPYFDRALALSPQNLSALMNRAIANLQLGNLDAAQRDYEAIVDLLPKPPYAVYYGLGEIHLQKKNARQAIKNYTEYLKLVPITSPEARLVQEKIKRLKSGSF